MLLSPHYIIGFINFLAAFKCVNKWCQGVTIANFSGICFVGYKIFHPGNGLVILQTKE
jgi:hypothetical protein